MMLKTGAAIITSYVSLAFTLPITSISNAIQPASLALGFSLFFIWATISRYIVFHLVKGVKTIYTWGILGDAVCVTELIRTLKQESPSDKVIVLDTQNLSLGNADNIEKHIVEKNLTGLIIATNKSLPKNVLTALMQIRVRGNISVYDFVDFYEQHFFKLPVLRTKDGWSILSQDFFQIHQTIQLRIKRATDVFLSIVSFIVAAPLMLVISILIKLDTGGAVIYSQKRSGLHGKIFKLYKFRTMVEDSEKEGPTWAEEEDTRVTRIGRHLRKTRLDELPQIWNVLRNDMSFVGPRAERPEFSSWLEKEIPYYNLRHLVKPGITGCAQVMFQYGSSVEDSREKLQYDLFYIKNFSLMLDIIILLKTIRVMLMASGR